MQICREKTIFTLFDNVVISNYYIKKRNLLQFASNQIKILEIIVFYSVYQQCSFVQRLRFFFVSWQKKMRQRSDYVDTIHHQFDVNDDKCNRKKKKIGLFLSFCFFLVRLYFAYVLWEKRPKDSHLFEIEGVRLHHS